MVSGLSPLPLRIRSPLSAAPPDGKRAFVAGGAQVRLRESAYPETFLNFRRGDPRGRPSVWVSARPGGRALQALRPTKGGQPRCAAPTADNGPFRRTAGGAIPYPLWPFGPSPLDKGSRPSPTVFKKLYRDWGGEALGPPARIRTRSVGSAKPGADLEPQMF